MSREKPPKADAKLICFVRNECILAVDTLGGLWSVSCVERKQPMFMSLKTPYDSQQMKIIKCIYFMDFSIDYAVNFVGS